MTSRRWAVLCAVALMTLGLAPAAAAAAESPGYAFGELRVIRNSEGFQLSACVGGPSIEGRRVDDIPNRARIYANDQLLRTESDVLTGDLQYWDEPPPPPCTPLVIVSAQLEVGLDELASVGIVEPSTGWRDFELRVVLEVDDAQVETRVTTALGGGPVQSAFNAAVPTPDGVRLEGWIMDPRATGDTTYVVTVDGRVFPGGEPLEPTSETGTFPTHWVRGEVENPVWMAAGLGTSHGLHLQVPYGEICLARVVEWGVPSSEGLEPFGCRTTVSGEVGGSIDSHVPRATGARIRGNLYSPWIGADEPWPLAFLVPDKGSPMLVDSATRRTGLAPEYGEIQGWFDFEVDMALPPGRRTVCLREMGRHTPKWAWPWDPTYFEEDDILGCQVIQVPHAPVGAAEVIVEGRTARVTGWAVDLNGGSPRVLVWVNGAMRAVTRTNERNAEITRMFGGDGRPGFTVQLSLPPGTHRVCTAWEDTSGGGWSEPSCANAVVK